MLGSQAQLRFQVRLDDLQVICTFDSWGKCVWVSEKERDTEREPARLCSWQAPIAARTTKPLTLRGVCVCVCV